LAVVVNRAEDRPGCDRALIQPGLQGAHRARGSVRAVRDFQSSPVSFLIGLRTPQRDHDTVAPELDMLAVEGYQF
jgi:hypothetical protein